jgi:DNA mismatch repair protein MutS
VPQRETTKQRRQQKSLFAFPEDPLLDEIRNMQVDNLSPMQALQELYRLRKQLTDRK